LGLIKDVTGEPVPIFGRTPLKGWRGFVAVCGGQRLFNIITLITDSFGCVMASQRLFYKVYYV